jgi:hypothetical protein
MGIKKIVFVVALACSLPALAQTDNAKNQVKLNLSAFVLKGINLQYERQLGPRITAALGYGMIPTTGIPFKSYITKQVNNSDVSVGNFTFSSSVITPEVRYYFGKDGAFHGFYIAPYMRIGSFKIDGPIEYTGSNKDRKTAVFNGIMHSIAAGLMMGSSFELSKKIYLDWWIVGASIGGSNGSVNAVTQLAPDEQAELKHNLDNLNIPLTKIQSEVNANGATITTTGNAVGLRGLGINLGFRF